MAPESSKSRQSKYRNEKAMKPELYKSRRWRHRNGEMIAVGTYVKLIGNNVQLRLGDGEEKNVPLELLCHEDLACILVPPKDSTVLSAFTSTKQLDDESPLTINLETLRSFSQSPTPVLWPAAQFYSTAKSDQDSLHDARVTHATSYHESGAVGHDYIVLGIDPNTGNPRDRFWLRCQRTPGAYDRGANIPTFRELLRTNRRFPAVDSIAFSFDESQLRSTNDTVIRMSTFLNVQVRHLRSLLETIYSVSPSYNMLSCNSWWFAGAVRKNLLLLEENQDSRRPGVWKRLAMPFRSSTAQEDHEVTKRFFERIDSGTNMSVKPPPTSEPSNGSSSRAFRERYSSLGDAGAKIQVSPPPSAVPLSPSVPVPFIKLMDPLECTVDAFRLLTKADLTASAYRIASLVRRRRNNGVRHEFLILHITGPHKIEFWMRLERGPLAPSFVPPLLSTFWPNDRIKVSTKQSSLLTGDRSTIQAYVVFRDPPTLHVLRRLLKVISNIAIYYNPFNENCWFYASIIQEVFTKWYEGSLEGALSHLEFGKGARIKIRASKHYIMGLPDAT